jgi:eukaryotic-like serine/threonine-protein kinase
LRDTDGSPPVRISDGLGLAISPDNRWVLTMPAKGGQLSLVPTGAGKAQQLTHDNVSYSGATFMADGKHILAGGIEPGHGGRDYLIDVSTGDSKPITPEGTTGTLISPEGRRAIMRGPDGRIGVWALDGSALQLIPDLDPRNEVIGWSPDGSSLYVALSHAGQKTVMVNKLDPATGKMNSWNEFGLGPSGGIASVATPHFSGDSRAYAYLYVRILSQAYVAKGLK